VYTTMTSPSRVGIGFDIHRLVEGRRLMLAGIEVPHPLGELAHSDGDVVLHALADAMLGAAGLGDIGEQFPDSDPAWKDADSAALLGRVVALVARAGWAVTSVDVNVLIERPKLAPHKAAMRERLAGLLALAPDAVGTLLLCFVTFSRPCCRTLSRLAAQLAGRVYAMRHI
jgi:2-C-methyl-D-erythritol 2,4-cyclodiphosphate synthase